MTGSAAFPAGAEHNTDIQVYRPIDAAIYRTVTMV